MACWEIFFFPYLTLTRAALCPLAETITVHRLATQHGRPTKMQGGLMTGKRKDCGEIENSLLSLCLTAHINYTLAFTLDPTTNTCTMTGL